jgi:hypothetical protein
MTTTEIPVPALRDIAAGLAAPEARWLVDYYYAVQDYRIQAKGQARAVAQNADEGVVSLAETLGRDMEGIEQEIQKALGAYAKAHRPGRWALSITGIGPVIAAGLLAHIDIRRAPTAGAIWSFAGLNPSAKWHGSAAARELVKAARAAEDTDWDALVWLCRALGSKPSHLAGVTPVGIDEARRVYDDLDGNAEASDRVEFHSDNLLMLLDDPAQAYRLLYPENEVSWSDVTRLLSKRPWNASLKVLCWKIGDSFVKQSGRESDIYGKVYRARKEQEVTRNLSGDFADQASQSLEERTIRDKDLRKTLESGRLPDGRIDLRARRYAVKLFLAHLHHVMHVCEFGVDPPKPYVIAHGDHVHFIAPPNWPCD